MKKKVLFVIWSFTLGGGAEKILANIVNNLSPEKYEISILEFANYNLKREKIREGIRLLEPAIEYLDYRKDETTSLIKRARVKLKSVLYNQLMIYAPYIMRRLLIRDNYDVEIAFNFLLPTFLVGEGSSNRKIAWIHETMTRLDYRNTKGILRRLNSFILNIKQRRALGKMDSIVAISNKSMEMIQNLFPETSDKITQIYNGYNFEDIVSKSKNDVEFDFSGKLIVSAGRLDKGKNFQMLIRAARILKGDDLDFTLLIIGEGNERGNLEALIEELDLTQQVKLPGYISNPYPYMKRADVFCLSSLSEGFPTVIAETMALEVPFVSTRVAGIDELSDNGKCGIVVGFNEEDMAQGIRSVLLNPDLRREKSINCKAVIQKFTLKNQIENLEKLLNKN